MIFIVFRDSFLLSIKLHIGIFAAVAILVVYFPFVDSTEDDPQGGQVHWAAGLLLQNMQRARSKVRSSPIRQPQVLHKKGNFCQVLLARQSLQRVPLHSDSSVGLCPEGRVQAHLHPRGGGQGEGVLVRCWEGGNRK